MKRVLRRSFMWLVVVGAVVGIALGIAVVLAVTLVSRLRKPKGARAA